MKSRKIRKLKGRVHCFSMQVVINKCFPLNLEKNGADPSYTQKTHPLISKNGVTEPKVKLL